MSQQPTGRTRSRRHCTGSDLLVNRRSLWRNVILGLGLVADETNHVVSQHALSLAAVNGIELLCCILATHHEDGLGTTRVSTQELGAIVHLAIMHKPDILPAVMLLHLHHSPISARWKWSSNYWFQPFAANE